MTGPNDRLPAFAAAIFKALTPAAELEELLSDLRAEYTLRARERGRFAAHRWVWKQALGSVPAMFRRSWWRGMTGFEPAANRLRPGGPMFESWIMDVRYAARRLGRRPTYAALAILTLALGAGGTAAIVSVVRTLLLDPLPIVREEQIGVLWFDGSWNEREITRLRGNFTGFQKMGGYRPNDQTLEVPGAPLRMVPGFAVTHELFDVLGTPPMLGRTFRNDEDVQGAEPVALLSYSLWEELGSNPHIVGSRLNLGGVPRTIVGVMPKGFWFPSPKTRIWTAAQVNPQNGSGRYTMVGRVAEGVSVDRMEGQLAAIAKTLGEHFRYPAQWDKTRAPRVTAAREFFVGDVRPSLVATLAAMGVILLIACANVAALMLGQIDAQATDLAVRAALGANRRRLVQQLIFEAILIGIAAGAAGALLAAAVFGLIVESLPLGELADNTRLDWTLFAASTLAALLAATLVAIVPGVALWRGSSLRATMSATRTGGIAGRGGRLEGGLVIAQMALAMMLAAGAGLLIRSVANLRGLDPGFDASAGVVVDATMPLNLPAEGRRAAINGMVDALRALPGVKGVAAAQKIPLRDSGDNWGVAVRGRPESSASTAFRMVTRDYFSTMGIPLRRGRTFDASDRDGSDRVVVVNEAMVAKFFPNGEDPIGKIVDTGFDPRGERIIGVVGNAAEAELTDAPVPARYMLYEHVPPVWHHVTFIVRPVSADAVPVLADLARNTLSREGTRLAVQNTTTLGSIVDLSLGPTGQVVTLVSLLALLALVLGAVGVYGVISHYVTRRTRDYAVCIALGQAPSRVVRQVVGRGAALVATGSAIGLVAAMLLTKLLASLLYGVDATDPIAMAGAVVALLIVGVLAAFIPGRRASLTNPATVLRQ